jgi:hypothetical protein
LIYGDPGRHDEILGAQQKLFHFLFANSVYGWLYDVNIFYSRLANKLIAASRSL